MSACPLSEALEGRQGEKPLAPLHPKCDENNSVTAAGGDRELAWRRHGSRRKGGKWGDRGTPNLCALDGSGRGSQHIRHGQNGQIFIWTHMNSYWQTDEYLFILVNMKEEGKKGPKDRRCTFHMDTYEKIPEKSRVDDVHMDTYETNAGKVKGR